MSALMQQSCSMISYQTIAKNTLVIVIRKKWMKVLTIDKRSNNKSRKNEISKIFLQSCLVIVIAGQELPWSRYTKWAGFRQSDIPFRSTQRYIFLSLCVLNFCGSFTTCQSGQKFVWTTNICLKLVLLSVENTDAC